VAEFLIKHKKYMTCVAAGIFVVIETQSKTKRICQSIFATASPTKYSPTKY
jgi:hypothetical protein